MLHGSLVIIIIIIIIIITASWIFD